MKIEICDQTKDVISFVSACIAITLCMCFVASCAGEYNRAEAEETKAREEARAKIETARYQAGIVSGSERKDGK